MTIRCADSEMITELENGIDGFGGINGLETHAAAALAARFVRFEDCSERVLTMIHWLGVTHFDDMLGNSVFA